MRLVEDGQTCESENLQAIQSNLECKQAIVVLQPSNCTSCVHDVAKYKWDTIIPSGCSTFCYDLYSGYYCVRFNEAKSNNVAVDSDAQAYIYCRTSPITRKLFYFFQRQLDSIS